MALGKALESNVAILPLLTLALGALAIVASLWWIYFDFTTGGAPTGTRRAQYFWGYAHYFVFAAAAAVGTGTALAVSWLVDPEHVLLPDRGVALVVGGAAALFLMTVALIESLAEKDAGRHTIPVKFATSLVMIGAALAARVVSVTGSVLLIAATLVVLVAYGVRQQHRLHRGG